MFYVLVNKQTGNYFMKEICNNEEGRCIDTDSISKAKKYDKYKTALMKSQFIGGMKYSYEVVEVID